MIKQHAPGSVAHGEVLAAGRERDGRDGVQGRPACGPVAEDGCGGEVHLRERALASEVGCVSVSERVDERVSGRDERAE